MEFALVLPPLLLLIFGVFEVGRLMWVREALQQTAVTGARCMGLTQTGCGTSGTYSASLTMSYVQAQAQNWSLSLSSSNISLNNSATCAGITGFSQVTLTYTFNTVVPQLIQALAGGAVLTATACFPNHA